MPAPTRTSSTAWVDAGLQALATGGPDAVRIEPLAQGLGVSKGGFYWHFKDRRAFLDALLDAWETRSTDDVLERVEGEGGDAGAKIARAGVLTFSRSLVAVDLAIRDWARHDAAVERRLRRVDDRRMDYLRSLFATLRPGDPTNEARSLLAFSLAIGVHVVAAGHGEQSRQAVGEAATRLLLDA